MSLNRNITRKEVVMTKQLGRIALATLAVVLLCASAHLGQDTMKPEHYAATWAVVGGVAD